MKYIILFIANFLLLGLVWYVCDNKAAMGDISQNQANIISILAWGASLLFWLAVYIIQERK